LADEVGPILDEGKTFSNGVSVGAVLAKSNVSAQRFGESSLAIISIASEQWLLKFFYNEPIDAPLVERAVMTLAQKDGINVAQTRLIKLAGFPASDIKRFTKTKASAFTVCLQVQSKEQPPPWVKRFK
jgi:hypothetical protein